jgi:hypothetical protein
MWKYPILGTSPTAVVCSVPDLATATSLVAGVEVCNLTTAWQEVSARSDLEITPFGWPLVPV